MRRLHNTAKSLAALNVFEQHEGMKPQGLWYGVDSAWLDWCSSEMPSWIHKHTYEIVLRPRARVLRLRTANAVRAFHRKYAAHTSWSYPNWVKLAKRYDGIEIAPYQWTLRLGWQTWYYSWDCASGCIWNPRAIASVREVEVAAVGGSLPQSPA